MPRLARLIIPGVPLHIVQRGVDRIRTFHADADFERYRHDLLRGVRATGMALHAYVLMPNHVHLLITPPDASSPATLMRRLGASFVRYINTRYGRTGTLWEGRFRSSIVDSDRYVLTCMRYIELNPVRAGLASTPDEYRWSSYRHHADNRPDTLVTSHPLYVRLGRSLQERASVYRSLCRQALPPEDMRPLRSAGRPTQQRVGAREGTEFATAGELRARFGVAVHVGRDAQLPPPR